MGGLPRRESFDERHQLTFVIHGTSGHDAITVGPLDHLGVKRRTVPQLQWIGGLHVVVPVVQHGWPVGRPRFGGHDRMLVRAVHGGFESDFSQPIGAPIGTALHVFGEGWVGADGWNGEQILDPLQRGISGGFVGSNGRFGG